MPDPHVTSPFGSQPSLLNRNKWCKLLMYADSIHSYTVESSLRWAGHGESLQRTLFCGSSCAWGMVTIRMPACLTRPAGRVCCETAGTLLKRCASTGRWAWTTLLWRIRCFHPAAVQNWRISQKTVFEWPTDSQRFHFHCISSLDFAQLEKLVTSWPR